MPPLNSLIGWLQLLLIILRWEVLEKQMSTKSVDVYPPFGGIGDARMINCRSGMFPPFSAKSFCIIRGVALQLLPAEKNGR